MRSIGIMICLLVLWSGTALAQDCDPPGEIAGTTQYSVQSSGMATNRIAKDDLYGVHITWMAGSSLFTRNVKYNFRSETGDWLAEDGMLVNEVVGAGYPTLTLGADNAAAVTYHNTSNNYVNLAVDNFRGMAIFSYFDPPDLAPSGNHAFWPQVAVSTNGDIHVLMVEHTQESGVYPDMLYSRSTDGGASWSGPEVAAHVALLNGCITASADGKVAIAYLKPVRGGEFSQIKNDVCYFISDDGRSWDFSDPINITDYANDNEDIFCPWGIDAVFDSEGNINAVWITGHIDNDGAFIDEVTKLWHYSEATGTITQIAESSDTLLTCTYGAVTLPISMPSLSYVDLSYTTVLGVSYIGYDDTDASSEGECLGDIYTVFGFDDGAFWTSPVNITETHTPGCSPGDCLSENFATSAEAMDETFYLTYVQQRLGDNPDTIYYLPVTAPIGDEVREDDQIPGAFSLLGNYPNPFNPSTTIQFQLEHESDIKLTVYDITGALVKVLYDGSMEAGRHSVVWHADDVASGMYFYKLATSDGSLVKKMVLLK